MRATISRPWAAAWVGLVAAAVAGGGCTRPVAFAEVSGTVTLDGAPLAGVTVVFLPQGEGALPQWIGRGTTDISGRYTVTGPEGQGGAAVATNRVTVRPPRTPRSPAEAAARPPGSDRPIPAKYFSPKFSPLVAEVKAGGPQTINLTLSSN